MIKDVKFVSEKDFSELYAKSPKKIKLDLKNVRQAFVYLGLQERLAPCILVAGTNGKGSTAGLLWHLFATCDLQAGLFTSPHICHFSERIQLSRADVTDDYLYCTWQKIRAQLPQALYQELSFFELTTLITLFVFKEKKTDINILEVGLGGRLDATNMIDPIISAVVSVGYDHQDILGDHLNQIAYEKLGIARKGRPLFWGAAFNLDSQVEEVLSKQQKDKEFILIRRDQHFSIEGRIIRLSLPNLPHVNFSLPDYLCAFPKVIKENFALALAIFFRVLASYETYLGPYELQERVERSLALFGQKEFKWPNTLIARFQWLTITCSQTKRKQSFLLDVCHNLDSAKVFCQSIKELSFFKKKPQKIPGIISILKDKDVGRILDCLREVLEPVFIFKVRSDRSIQDKDLIAYHSDLECYESFNLAWFAQQSKCSSHHLPVAICGSFYAIGEVLNFFHAFPKEQRFTRDLSGFSLLESNELCQ